MCSEWQLLRLGHHWNKSDDTQSDNRTERGDKLLGCVTYTACHRILKDAHGPSPMTVVGPQGPN